MYGPHDHRNGAMGAVTIARARHMANVPICLSRAPVGVVRRPPARNLSPEGPSPQGVPLSAPAPDLCTLRAARLAALHTTVVVERGSVTFPLVTPRLFGLTRLLRLGRRLP